MKRTTLFLLKLTTLAVAITVLSACGGGGGGGVATTQADTTYLPPPQTSPSPGSQPVAGCTTCDEYAAEYSAQYGLAMVNAAGANDDGYTGWNIRTAVVDTGIDANHPEFTGRTILGRDFGSNGTLGYLSDVNGHGTHVASIAAANRNAAGMRGVAYDSLLYSYRVDNGITGPFGRTQLVGVSSDAAWAQVIEQHIADSIDVSNNSWGSSIGIDDASVSESSLRSFYAQSIPALRRAQQQGTIFVFSAGNTYGGAPSETGAMPVYITELRDQWLMVVAVGSDKVEANYTSRCGAASDFCVTAPGTAIYAADANSSSYTTLSGTSMAAPHVAGVVGVVYQRFPELTAAQVTARVKATASLDGLTTRDGKTTSNASLAEMQAVFGHGLVNADAAVQPISTLVYSTDGTTSSASGHAVGSARLMVLSGMGKAIAEQLRATQVAVFDSFDGATFFVPASEVFDANQKQSLGAIGYASASHAEHSQKGIAAFASTFTDNRSTIPMYVSFSNNSMTAMSATSWGEKVGLMAQPALLLNQSTQQFEWGLVNNERLSVRPFTQFAQDDAGKLLGAGVNLSFQATESLRAHLSLAQSEAPFNNGINNTNYTSALPMNAAELGLEHDISPKLSVFARSRLTDLGSVSASAQQWGINGGQILQHQLGIELKLDQARIAFGAYDPGQMQNGEISLLVPYGRTQEGQVLYREQRFSVDQNPQIGAFIAAKAPLKFGSQHLGVVTFSLQQSPYDPTEIGRASLTYSHRF